jgi:RNA polymerase sigma factor (sigma-70 family)
MASYETLNDQQLTGLFRSGDHAAFTEIHNRFLEILINAAYQRLKSREAAEEAVQEIFVNLYIRRAYVHPKAGLEAYLKTALKFKVIDACRAQQTYYTHLDSIIYESKLQSADHDREFEISEMRNRINIDAAKMPGKCREVFLLSKLEQLSQFIVVQFKCLHQRMMYDLRWHIRLFDHRRIDLFMRGRRPDYKNAPVQPWSW